jgi:hypothetical protein
VKNPRRTRVIKYWHEQLARNALNHAAGRDLRVTTAELIELVDLLDDADDLIDSLAAQVAQLHLARRQAKR